MKIIHSIIVAVALLVSSTSALADTAKGAARPVAESRKAAAIERRIYRNYLRIRFPWRTCTVWYTARVPYPDIIRGYACGTYVICRRTWGRNYLCRY